MKPLNQVLFGPGDQGIRAQLPSLADRCLVFLEPWNFGRVNEVRGHCIFEQASSARKRRGSEVAGVRDANPGKKNAAAAGYRTVHGTSPHVLVECIKCPYTEDCAIDVHLGVNMLLLIPCHGGVCPRAKKKAG